MSLRKDVLDELVHFSQSIGMYPTARQLRECGDIGTEKMRICQPCRRILPVSDFGTNRERIPDKVCKECKLTARQKLLASRR